MSARGAAAALAGLSVLFGALAAPVRGSDALYIVDQLVVSVNSAADGSGERVASLKSGDRVELIERLGEAVHVRLAGGREGWLRAIYLSGDEPLRPRLAQSEAQVARLQAQVSSLEAQLNATASIRAGAPPAAGAAGTEDSSPPAPGPLFANAGDAVPRRVWPWALGSALVALAVGFALGWGMLDRNIRRKYGGLRIY